MARCFAVSSALFCAVFCAVLCVSGLALAEKPYFSREECITNGEKLFGDISFLLEDQDAVSCASGAGEACCRALDKYFGEESDFWGCPCYQDLFAEGLKQVPAFARPLVTTRMVECKIPTPGKGCTIVDSGNTTTNLTEPKFNQTSSMMQYSGPYSFMEKGYDTYGEWFPCRGVPDAQYCVVLLTPPNVFSETKWGICVPKSLSDTDINKLIVDTSPDHYAVQPPKAYCTYGYKLPRWTTGGITVCVLLGLIALMVVVATVVGYCHRTFGVFGKDNVCLKLITAFDLMPNWTMLVSTPKVEESGIDLRSLNGLRTLSMFWIILGHTGSGIYFDFNLQYFSYWAFNPQNYLWLKDWFFPLYAGLFGVDSFLFISGLLVAYKFSEQMAKRAKKQMNWKKEVYFWAMYGIARWLRLLPVLVAVMFTSWKLVGNLSIAPGWSIHWNDTYNTPCSKYWWATLLFIQNLYPGGDSFGMTGKFCVGISWYLAVDMQLYLVVAPIVLIAWHYGFYLSFLKKARKALGSFLVAALVAVAVGVTAYIVQNYNVMWQFLGVGDFERYYIKPWTRAPPYILGLALGLLLHELSQQEDRKALKWLKEKARSWAILLIWLIAFGVLLLLTFTPAFYLKSPEGKLPPLSENTGAGLTPAETHSYMASKYVGWGICLFVIFGINTIGRGWLVNDLLSGYIWAPLAKLTYCAYLITYLIQDVVKMSLITHPVYYNTWTTLSYWIAFICGGYFFSLVAFLCIEAPFGNYLKMLIRALHRTPSDDASLEKMEITVVKEDSAHVTSPAAEHPSQNSSGEIEILRKVSKSFLESEKQNGHY